VTPDANGEEADRASSLPGRAATLLVRATGAVSVLLILAALAATTYSVIARYVFNAPPLGYGLVALVMAGAAEAYRRGDHIAIDLVTNLLSARARVVADTFADFAVLVFAGVLGWSTWDALTFAYDFGSYAPGYLEVEIWIPQSPLLLGAALLGLVAVSRIVGRLAGGGR
jgi:TRAP-type C4-dicarboxylate transport system permease small subunit